METVTFLDAEISEGRRPVGTRVWCALENDGLDPHPFQLSKAISRHRRERAGVLVAPHETVDAVGGAGPRDQRFRTRRGGLASSPQRPKWS